MTKEQNSTAATLPAASARGKVEVLIVDDDPHFCELARNLLAFHGLRGTAVHSIAEGLTYVKTHGRDVAAVVMDLVLPDGDGLQAIRAFKAALPTRKVIAVSGMDAADLYRLTDAHPGADAVLSKSHVERLPALVNGLLESR